MKLDVFTVEYSFRFWLVFPVAFLAWLDSWDCSTTSPSKQLSSHACSSFWSLRIRPISLHSPLWSAPVSRKPSRALFSFGRTLFLFGCENFTLKFSCVLQAGIQHYSRLLASFCDEDSFLKRCEPIKGLSHRVSMLVYTATERRPYIQYTRCF